MRGVGHFASHPEGNQTKKRMMTILRVAALGMGLSAPAAQGQDTAVKTVVEKYKLLGTFAQDCAQPASQTNWYFVHRAIDDDHVQRDLVGESNGGFMTMHMIERSISIVWGGQTA
jgi:hypothetical protein